MAIRSALVDSETYPLDGSAELIPLLPAKADPAERLEYLLALQAVQTFIRANPHRAVRIDAPRIVFHAKSRGINLPLSAVSWAIGRFTRGGRWTS